MNKRIRIQPIRTTVRRPLTPKFFVQINGWLSGRGTFLRLADEHNNYLGSIDGQSLYRLAKAIVKRFES